MGPLNVAYVACHVMILFCHQFPPFGPLGCPLALPTTDKSLHTKYSSAHFSFPVATEVIL